VAEAFTGVFVAHKMVHASEKGKDFQVVILDYREKEESKNVKNIAKGKPWNVKEITI